METLSGPLQEEKEAKAEKEHLEIHAFTGLFIGTLKTTSIRQ